MRMIENIIVEKISDTRCLPVNPKCCIYKGDTYGFRRNYKNVKIFFNTDGNRNGWYYIVVKKSETNDQVIFRWSGCNYDSMIEVLENTYDLGDDE